MAKQKSQAQRITETAYAPEVRVDEENHVIRGVKFLGLNSKNGRRYAEAAVMAAIDSGLYEGVEVNIDHQQGSKLERGMTEGWGRLLNTRYVSGDGGYADLHYLKAHPSTDLIIERAKRWPNSFGLSHDAEAKMSFKDKEPVVEGIQRVYSVDVVRTPATTAGLHESYTEESDVSKITEMDDMGGPVDAGDPLAVLQGAMQQIVSAIIADGGLDAAGKASKIKDVLKGLEKFQAMVGGNDLPATEPAVSEPEVLDEAPAEEADAEEETDKPAMESLDRVSSTIRESVQDALQPLLRRVSLLERGVQDLQLPEQYQERLAEAQTEDAIDAVLSEYFESRPLTSRAVRNLRVAESRDASPWGTDALANMTPKQFASLAR